tara:strand:- start:124 stop:504 length:381 start_codon:yes stop_codon:yes gene_type:complete
MKKNRQGEGGGRAKVVLSDKQIIELEALASVLTKQQIADYFGIGLTTLKEIEKRQPEVSDSYKKGKVKQIANMGNNLVKLAMDGNVTANIFYLKTQAHWKEEETEVKEIPPINITLDSRAANAPTK